MSFPVLCARLRMPLAGAGLVLVVGSLFVGVPSWLAAAVLVVGLARLGIGHHHEPVASPDDRVWAR